jgi:hypothetical protein
MTTHSRCAINFKCSCAAATVEVGALAARRSALFLLLSTAALAALTAFSEAACCVLAPVNNWGVTALLPCGLSSHSCMHLVYVMQKVPSHP